MTGYFENKSANNVEADPLMVVLRLEGLNKELNQGLFGQIQKSLKHMHA